MNFTVETSEIAEAEIDAIFISLNARNPEFAGRWLVGLDRVLAGLSTFPGRYPRVEDNALRGQEVRKVLYRNGQMVYQILFELIDLNANGEPETARVLHVRYAAQRTMRQPEDDE